jgi:signal transduction histidine kinase
MVTAAGEPDGATTPLGRNNPRLKHLRRLVTRRDERDRAGVVVLEGPVLVTDALVDGAAVDEVFCEPDAYPDLTDRARAAGAAVHVVPEGALASILSTVTPRPVAAVVRRSVVGLDEVVAASLATTRPLLILAGVSDPGNAGGVLRTAEAAGVAGVVFAEGSVDPFAPKVARASAGSVLRVPIVVGVDAEEALRVLGAAGVVRIATEADGGRPPEEIDLRRPVGLVLGSEAHGVAPEVRELVDEVVSIPMAGGTESLNVTVAGAVTLFDGARQRREFHGARQGPELDAATVDVTRAPASAAAELIARAGHEIRSPLSAVKGFSSVLVDRWDRFDDDKKRTMLADVATEADRLDRMITEILDLSRVEAGRLRLDRQPVDLARVVRDARDRVLGEYEGVEIDVDVADGLGPLVGDHTRLERIVANLLENAVKYGEAHTVTVTGRRDRDEVHLTVGDLGPGMAPDDLASLFDARRRTTGDRPTGTGLGLWIGREVVEAHGGTLTVASSPGSGTQVTVTLPVTEP